VHTSNPAVDLLHALYFHLTWAPCGRRRGLVDGNQVRLAGGLVRL